MCAIRDKWLVGAASAIVGIGLASPAAAAWHWGGEVYGVCGPANGETLASAPASGLCQSGAATALTGDGPWNWSCLGSRGGSSAGCEAYAEAAPPPLGTTRAGVPLPSGWSLQVSDIFGTGAGSTVTNYTQLHSRYCEGQFYNVDSNCLVKIPNTVINGEQETYEHFETSIAFFTDHIEIQGRGQPSGAIYSAEMVSKNTPLSFCAEAYLQIPNTLGSWPAFWWYASATGNTAAEIDYEWPLLVNGAGPTSVHNVSMFAHGSIGNGNWSISVPSSEWNGPAALYAPSPAVDFSAAPHYYTMCYNDTAGTTTRWVDGVKVVEISGAKWAGPNPATIINLAVGGNWPGDLSGPSAYSGNLDIYTIEYYGP